MKLTDLQKARIAGMLETNLRKRIVDDGIEWGNGWDHGYREGYADAVDGVLRALGYEVTIDGKDRDMVVSIEKLYG